MSNIKIQKPVIKWVGGKTQIIKEVMSRFPSTMENYHEIFLGGGSVLFALLSYKKAGLINIQNKIYVYDINKLLINLYKNIQNNKDDLYVYIDKYFKEYSNIDTNKGNKKPNSLEEAKTSKESYYYWIRNKFNLIDKESIECSALFMFINKTCFRGMYREGPNGFNVPFGHYVSLKNIIDKTELDFISVFIKDVEFIHSDFSDSINKVGINDFVYLDPPYTQEKDKKSFLGYVNDGFNNDLQLKLFNMTKSLKDSKFLMSNSNADLVKDSFKDYNCDEIKARRAINSLNPGSTTKELLIYN